MKLGVTRASASSSYNGLGDQLYDLGGARPTLDLNFSSNESLVDSVTGKTLVDHTRQSSATYVDGDGVIRTAVTNLLLRSEEFDTTWTPTNTTVSVDQIGAPDGTSTADKIVETATTAEHNIRQDTASQSAGTYTISIFAKAGERSNLQFVATGVLGGYRANFDLANGVLGSVDTQLTASIEPYPNGWYRCIVTATSSTSGTLRAQWNIITSSTAARVESYAGDITKGLYLWGAQLEESSTVGQYVKTTTAKNGAPRFDHDPETGESLGLLVEESRQNLLLRSEDFSTTWGLAKMRAFGSGSTVNAVIAPDGTLTADHIVEDTSTGNHNIAQSAAVVSGSVYSISVYAKAPAQSRQLQILVANANFTVTPAALFDVSTGSVVSSVHGTASMVPFGNGWYRCQLTTISATSSGSNGFNLRFYDGATNSYTGDDTSGLYLWGAQLEAGSFPTSYIPTEGLQVTRAADVASIEERNFGSVNLLSYSEEFDQAAWIPAGSSITPNALTAPDGNLTADALVDTTLTEVHSISQTLVGASGNTTYTISCRFKKGSQNYGCLVFGPNAAWGAGGGAAAFFDLVNGTASTVASATATIEPLADGWYFCTASATTTASPGNPFFRFGASANGSAQTYTGTGEKAVYLWGAQLEEGSTATGYIKSDVNWTSRASNATYYDVNGTLKKSSYNELLRSEEFDNAIWTKAYLIEDITPNTAIAPNGLLVADQVASQTGPTAEFGVGQTVSVTANQPHTFSVFAKAATSNYVYVRYYGGTTANFYTVIVDLSNGAVTNSGTGSSTTNASYSVVAYPDGWYRIACTATHITTNNVGIVGPAPSATAEIGANFGQVLYAGNSGLSIYLWGAQLETGTYAGDYAKTTTTAVSTARTAAYLPDGNGNFVSAGDLLLEDAGTNLVTYSEEFDNAAWNSAAGQRTVNPNQIAAPDGAFTADLVTANGTNAPHFVSQAVTLTATPYTFSVFAKAGTNNFLQIRFFVAFGDRYVNFDLANGTVGTSNNITTASIVPVGDGWYRCIVIVTPTAASSSVGIYLVSSDTAGSGEINTLSTNLYLWGAQLEESSYPTSYIPTSGSAATRAADVSTSAATVGHSWYKQSEGTVFADSARTSVVPTATFPQVFYFSDGTGDNAINIGYLTAASSQFRVRTAGTNEANLLPSNSNLRRIVAGCYRVNDAATSDGGGAVLVSGTSVTLPSGINKVTIGGSQVSANPLNGTIRRLTYWPTRLSNDTLQTITQ